MHIHPRSVAHKVFDIWRSPGRFTKNPDLIRLPSGRLMLVDSGKRRWWADLGQTSRNRQRGPAPWRRATGHTSAEPSARWAISRAVRSR